MPTSEFENGSTGKDAPMTMSQPLSPLSPIRSSPSGLHINPEPGEEPYIVQSPSVYDPGETSRRVSLPSTSRQGSISYQGHGSQSNNLQTWDSHVSDPQSTEAAPYINHTNRPVLAHHRSSTSQSNIAQNNERQDNSHEYTQAESHRQSNPFTGNLCR
jgi:hypothetical protein